MTRSRFRTTDAVVLTAQAWLALAVYDLAIGLGFSRVYEHVRRHEPRRNRRMSSTSVEDVVWAVDEACVWYVKRALCLQRSVAVAWLLRRRGVRADLVIGYRPLPFESHAWVEVDGRVVNDRQQYRNVFTVLERL